MEGVIGVRGVCDWVMVVACFMCDVYSFIISTAVKDYKQSNYALSLSLFLPLSLSLSLSHTHTHTHKNTGNSSRCLSWSRGSQAG